MLFRSEPLHSPPAPPERPLQAQAETSNESPTEPIPETSGGITNRKFDFEGYGVVEPEVSATPTVDMTVTENAASTVSDPTVASPTVTEPSVADLGPERPAEVDMPEGA